MTNSSDWTRREFIAGIAGASGLAAATSRKLGYIDAHAHVWSGDTARWPRAAAVPGQKVEPTAFLPEELLGHGKPSGVTRVVLIQRGFHGNDNRYMFSVLQKQRDRFSAVARIDHLAPNAPATMKQLEQQGARGFRISPDGKPLTWLDSAGMDTLWRFAAERRLAICPLVDPNALPSIERMCARHPETTVVIDHLCRIGVSGSFEEADIRALCALGARKQVHVKVSGFHALGGKAPPYLDLRPLIRRVYDAYGASRLMWGTDAPSQVINGNSYQAAFALVNERLDFLSKSDRDWILRGTAERIFF